MSEENIPIDLGKEEPFLTFAEHGEGVLSNVYFQFDDDEPIMIAENISDEFSMRLFPTGNPKESIEFTDGKGKHFAILIKPKS